MNGSARMMLLSNTVKTVLLAGLLFHSHQTTAAKAPVATQSPPSVSLEEETKRLDKAFEANKMMMAIKTVDLAEYTKFRGSVIKALSRGNGQVEVDTMARNFGNQFMVKRLRHASAATIKQYIQWRLKFYKRINAESPEPLYGFLVLRQFEMPIIPSAKRTRVIWLWF